MNTHTGAPKRLTILSLIVLIVAVALGVAAVRRQGQQEVKLPKKFLSEVKHLEVESAKVESLGGQVFLVVLIRNKSDLAVTAFTVSVGDIHVGKDGGIFLDEAAAVIEPRATTTIEIPVSNFIDDEPLVITEAFYADGTEDGREEIRNWTRKDRAREKAKRAAKKGAPQ